jgi:hypothetical protein
VSADGTELKNKCFDVTTSYGQCEPECKDEKLSNGANWLCYQDAKNQAIWGDDSDCTEDDPVSCTYWKKLLGGNSVSCDDDDTVGQCTTLDLLKKNADGEALAKATGFCKEPTNSELVDWFFDCDKYPFDEELSLLEYARCMKEPDCPENFTDSVDELPAEQENNTDNNNNNIENNNNIIKLENNEKEDGEPFFTSAEILNMVQAGFTYDQIKALEQMG